MTPLPAIQPTPPPALANWEARVRRISACRICGNTRLSPVLDLGAQYLASLFDDGRPQNQLQTPVPLTIVRCDPAGRPDACRFVQLTHTVPPDVLYYDYGYRSGINATMRRHLEGLVREAESRVPLRADDIVVDIGANDGVTLQAYQRRDLVRVGFEPSNIRPDDQTGLTYIPAVFNVPDFRARFPGRTARIITSIAMFYDLDDPLAFCRGVRDILADDGLWVVEMSCLGDMLRRHSFDTICHEHLGYYSLSTLQHVTRQADFVLYDIGFNAANGGSMRCTFTKRQGGWPVPAAQQERIQRALADEAAQGLQDAQIFEDFRGRVDHIRRRLLETLTKLQQEGKRIYGYGASTKGNVLLQTAGIGPQHLIAIADRNPAKVGRHTLGTRIPICSEEEMRNARPDYLLVLPWHFLDEFLAREQSLRDAGTRFIVAFPEVRVV